MARIDPFSAPRGGSADRGQAAPLVGQLAPELRSRVRQIEIKTRRLVDAALAGGYRSTFHGQGLEFFEVRPYLPGDEVRSIDWKVTARTGEPWVKTYAEERELTLTLLVDTSRSMDFGSRRWTKREAAAQFTALVALCAARVQDRVGLDLFGEEPGLHLPAKKGTKHILRVIREVMAAAPSPGGSDFKSILEEKSRALRRRSLIFLVSDFLDQDRCEGWSEVLARLGRRHDVIAVRLVDPLEEELSDAGWIRLREIEGGRVTELDSRSHEVRSAWARRGRERREQLDDVLQRARVDSIRISTQADLADPVVDFFRRRARRRVGLA